MNSCFAVMKTVICRKKKLFWRTPGRHVMFCWLKTVILVCRLKLMNDFNLLQNSWMLKKICKFFNIANCRFYGNAFVLEKFTGDLPKTLRKLCVFATFSHQEIAWRFYQEITWRYNFLCSSFAYFKLFFNWSG